MRARTRALFPSLALLSACDPGAFGLQPDVERVVLTPGGTSVVGIDIVRPEGHDETVEMSVLGLPDGVTATFSEDDAVGDRVTLTFVASATMEARDKSIVVKGHAAHRTDVDDLEVSVQVPGPPSPGVEEFAPGVVGVLETLEIDGAPLTFEVIDGMAVIDGDIVLGEANALREAAAGITPRSITCNPILGGDFGCARWTDGVIGYRFANDWGDDDEDARMQAIILEAIDFWEVNTGMRFEERQGGELVEFRDGNGCWSSIGRAVITGFDVQSITLDNSGCDDSGIAAHEIGHAIGIYHEQSRDDRDEYVTVQYDQIREGRAAQFDMRGGLAEDRGPYDYESIMHYRRSAFSIGGTCNDDDMSGCTIVPLDPTVSIGQRDYLSEGDILGAYSLYPPEFSIVGTDLDVASDRFFMWLDFDTPAPAAARFVWTVDDDPTPVGTGHTLTLRADDVGNGEHAVRASFVVAGMTLSWRTVYLDFDNDAPVVTLSTDDGSLEQQAGQVFTVTADVVDAQDGACPPEVCTYEWMPTPAFESAGGAVASFVFDTVGPQDITVAVMDHGGAIGTATIPIEVVGSAPTATIVMPFDGTSVPQGSQIIVEGIGHDVNEATGTLPCTALAWSSSNPSDVFSSADAFCRRRVSFADAGTRTISLVATDGSGIGSAPATIDVNVSACAGNCPPTGYLWISPPHDNGVYLSELDTDIHMVIADDVYEIVEVTLVASHDGVDVPIYETDVLALMDEPLHLGIGVQLVDDLGTWPECSSFVNFRDYDIVLTTVDATGLVTVDARTITVGCGLI
jgi:hypothetical protein